MQGVCTNTDKTRAHNKRGQAPEGEKAPCSSMQGKCTIAEAAEPLVARCCASTFQHSRVEIVKCLAGIIVNAGRRDTKQTGEEAKWGQRCACVCAYAHAHHSLTLSHAHVHPREHAHTSNEANGATLEGIKA